MHEAVKAVRTMKLTASELQVLINVLYSGRWTGKEWNETMTPLINKMSVMVKKAGEVPKKAEEGKKLDKE